MTRSREQRAATGAPVGVLTRRAPIGCGIAAVALGAFGGYVLGIAIAPGSRVVHNPVARNQVLGGR